MNDLIEAGGPGALAMREEELVSVLSNSIYPGAKLESIKMVVGYCKAARLDPLQKPVHIVPMSVKKPGTRDQYEWRDVVMPGIGLYRTQAARGGKLAGIDEPEFGPMVEMNLNGTKVTVPEWCRVTVYRMVDGERCAFTAVEFWIENYATAGKDTERPNAMWKKRPRGQLAKCAEAQALRKAFPEVGAQPTAEEMEGKILEGEFEREPSDAGNGFKVGRKAGAAQPEERVVEGEVVNTPASSKGKRAAAKPAEKSEAPAGDEPLVGVGEVAYLKNKAAAVGVELDVVLRDEFGGLALEKLTKSDFQKVKTYLMDVGG